MKTLCTYSTIYGNFVPKPGVKYFCIGVKNRDSYSLEKLQLKYPKMIIERKPEVPNPRYMGYGPDYVVKNNMLQPAFVTIPVEKKEK